MPTNLENYLKSAKQVSDLMSCVASEVERYARDDSHVYAENEISLATEYAYTYVLRDVMTLLLMGYELSKAVELYKGEGAVRYINLEAACENALYEASEFFDEVLGNE